MVKSGAWLSSPNPCRLRKLVLRSGPPLPSPLGSILDGLSFLNFASEPVPPAGPEASFLHAQEDSLRLQHEYQGVEPRGTHGALGFCREGKGLGQLDLGVDGSVCIAVARGRVDRKCALQGTERQRPSSVTCSRFSGADRGLAPRTQGHQCPGPSLTGLIQQVR